MRQRRVTGATRIKDIRLDVVCEVENFPLTQVIEVVEEMVRDRIFHWAGPDRLVLLDRSVTGEVIH